MEVVEVLLMIAGLLLTGLGIVGCIVPGLPGPILSYLSLVAVHFGVEGGIKTWILLVMLGLTLVASLLDYLMPAYTTKRYGGTKSGIWGGMIGIIIGLFFPPFGIILGPLLGAIIGDLIGGSQFQKALRSGFGAFMGLVVATAVKLSVSTVIAIIITIYIGRDIIELFRSL